MKMTLEKFADALPIPDTLKPVQQSKDSTYYEVTMEECYHQLHRDLLQPACGAITVYSPVPPLRPKEMKTFM